MDREALVERLSATFSPGIRSAIVEALHVAYSDAIERYDEAVGCNGATFGTDIYNFACHRLQEAATDGGDSFVLVRRYPAFRLDVGGFEVGCHRVGDSDSSPISQSFPTSEFAGTTLASAQLDLFGSVGESIEGGVVIAHQGSPERGLCAVYLCLPDSVNHQGRIDHWGHIELLWKVGDEVAAAPVEVTLPPVEDVPMPVVRRKRDKGGSE